MSLRLKAAYPGMITQGGVLAITEATISGLLLVLAIPGLLSGTRMLGHRGLEAGIFILAIALAIWPHPAGPAAALTLLVAAWAFGRQQRAIASDTRTRP